jgi:hypothetical protein
MALSAVVLGPGIPSCSRKVTRLSCSRIQSCWYVWARAALRGGSFLEFLSKSSRAFVNLERPRFFTPDFGPAFSRGSITCFTSHAKIARSASNGASRRSWCRFLLRGTPHVGCGQGAAASPGYTAATNPPASLFSSSGRIVGALGSVRLKMPSVPSVHTHTYGCTPCMLIFVSSACINGLCQTICTMPFSRSRSYWPSACINPGRRPACIVSPPDSAAAATILPYGRRKATR